MAIAPRTGRSSPPSESSPANSQPARRAALIWPLAARMPSAIGRSKRPESLGRSAGARFTVMRLLDGNSSPALAMAERTRSRASFTSVSARPTNVKLGRPLARWTSTCTGRASRPSRARLRTKDRLIAIHSLFRCVFFVVPGAGRLFVWALVWCAPGRCGHARWGGWRRWVTLGACSPPRAGHCSGHGTNKPHRVGGRKVGIFPARSCKRLIRSVVFHAAVSPP
ncbi:hypothetical protein D9M68_718350 [compost metagenome]